MRSSLWWLALAACGGSSASPCLDAGITCIGGDVCIETGSSSHPDASCVALPAACDGIACDGIGTCDDALGALCPQGTTFGGGSGCVEVTEDGETLADHVLIGCF